MFQLEQCATHAKRTPVSTFAAVVIKLLPFPPSPSHHSADRFSGVAQKQDPETRRLSDAAASQGKPVSPISFPGFTQESIFTQRLPCLVAIKCERVAWDSDSAAAVDAAPKEMAH